MQETFGGKLAIQQRVLAAYRAPFFEALAQVCTGGLSIFAGLPRVEEHIPTTHNLRFAQAVMARNVHLLGGVFYLCYQRGLLNWLRNWEPDALIVEANPRYLSTPAAVRWMKRRGRPVLAWGLGAPPVGGLAGRFRSVWRRAYLGQFDALLTYSQRGAEEYALLGFPSDRIFVAPNAAAPRPTHPLPERPPHFEGRPTVLFVGRLQKRKRIDDLLFACASLPEMLRPRVVIVGEGPERPVLEALARQIYPLAEFVGAKHGEALHPYFLAADVFVLPGTGGLAVQEAMAWGLPIIMGEGDGTNQALVRPENGWQAQGPEALAEALRQALSDVPRLRRMGGESYRIVREEVNLEIMVTAFIQALNALFTAKSNMRAGL
ncbi:MAG: glycosyltransferase family 4 protein [Anaerolineales bacterium]|nr:glycosyltransferase family 4 protein [Anaerolineales bacterium]MCX7607735.1 glycosyltransferase family 4 protein [Anaerolineales bacterium]MDW8226308.1 glycosyltransferase family 4 protein [Anaerolineales bacterium]